MSHDTKHNTTERKLKPDMNSQKTPHTSPLRASYGVSLDGYLEKSKHEISQVQLKGETSCDMQSMGVYSQRLNRCMTGLHFNS